MKGWLKHLRDFAGLLQYLRPYLGAGRGLLLAVLASSLAMTVFEGVGVGLLVPLLSLLLGGEQAKPMRPIQFLQAQFPGHSPAFYVGVCCVAIVGAISAKNLGGYVSHIFSSRLKRRISVNLRDALFARLQQAPLELFDSRPAGEIANIFLVESSRASAAFDGAIGLIQRGSIALVYLGVLFYISWPLTLLVVGLGAAIGLSLSFAYGRLTQAGTEVTEINHRLAGKLQQSFAGVRVVRAANSQSAEIRTFHDLNDAQARAEERSHHALALLFPVTETVAVVGAMCIVTVAYIFWVKPGRMLSSYLLGYGFVLLRLLPLLYQLYGMQGHLLYLAGGIREVRKWLDTPIFPERPFGTRAFAGVHRSVAFEHVSFTYGDKEPALSDVSFEIPAGKTVAIVGPSGSGKSTLAALLLRLRAPASGCISVDGVDAWEFSPASWHEAVFIVEQDAFLFHGTLRENVLYACATSRVDALPQAIASANLEDVVAHLPQGLDTLVGDRGGMLSGGQRQRVAIARAVVRNPAILILDEATSHLDSVSEQLVQQALNRAARGRTTMVIAHRMSTIREADWIVVLEKGRVVQQGTWDDLKAQAGMFDRLLSGVARA
jgi:ATP-binding cassette, subfamily B, bacterial MsbA